MIDTTSKRSLALALISLLATGCPPPKPDCDDGPLCAPIATGSVPNDVALTTCNSGPAALVVASGDARLDAISLPDGEVIASTIFPPSGDRAASPWAVALDDASGLAVVTLFGQDALALANPCTGELIGTFPVDGASTPQPVIVVDGRAIVGFTNVEHVSTGVNDPPVLGLGVVASFTIDGDEMTPGPAQELTCKNPQGLTALESGAVLASCSGPLGPDGAGRQRALEDGALVILDGTTLAPQHTIGAARAAPGTAAAIGDTIVAGSVVTSALLRSAVDDLALAEETRFDGPEVDSLFEIEAWDASTILVPQFSADTIHVVTVPAAAGEALVIADAIAVGAGGTAFRGLLAVDVKPGLGDVDGVALFTLSSEIVPLRLHLVLP